MRILAITLCFILFGFLSVRPEEIPRLHDEYDPNKWPEAELKLSQAADLKDIFDSGLRPYRFPGLENTTLEGKHLALSIRLGSGKSLPPLDVEVIRIKPFRDGKIGTIEGFTPKLSLDQARQEMIKWLPFAANQRTEQDLEDYLAAVKADFLDFDDPYRGVAHGCGVGWREPGFETYNGGPQVGVGFRKTANPELPLRLHFWLSWNANRPIKDTGSYRPNPIEPPPGYEHVDMTAPANFGPDSMVAILRSKGVDVGDGKGGIPYEEHLNPKHVEVPGEPPVLPIPDDKAPAPPAASSKAWFWIFFALVVVALALVVWHKLLR